jgi:hypothetical protein
VPVAEPVPSGLITLTGRILHCQQTPDSPAVLLPAAAMMLAAIVPWPWSSLASVSLLTKS